MFVAKLKQSKTGFVYLDINEDLTKGLLSLLKDKNAKKTPYQNKSFNSLGSHVSVISDKELEGKDIKIKELCEIFEFKIVGAKQTNPEGWGEMKQVYFLEIECPELKTMRKSYGLPATYNGKGHKFHITFALEKS